MDTNQPPPRKILVVDDDAETSRAIADILTSLGYESLLCRHAQEAMTCLECQPVDLMLIDYRMPEMTGLDLVSMIREEGREISIIIMSGHPRTKDRFSSQAVGVSAVLIKPITVPVLAEALETAFRRRVLEANGKI